MVRNALGRIPGVEPPKSGIVGKRLLSFVFRGHRCILKLLFQSSRCTAAEMTRDLVGQRSAVRIESFQGLPGVVIQKATSGSSGASVLGNHQLIVRTTEIRVAI
jgi:hypothetical protein